MADETSQPTLTTPGNKQSLLIVGTGAMACLFAARFAASGIPFQMLGSWPEGVAALQQNGVRLIEANGSQNSYPVQITTQPEACAGALLALVVVKSWQTEGVASQLAKCLSPEGLALTLQNGIGNREILARRLGAGRVALGVTTLGANLIAPGVVRPAGEGTTTLSNQPRLAPLVEALRKSGLLVEYAPDANALLWGKLVINAAINPLTALLGVPNGDLLERPTARALMAAVAREAAAVAVAQGIALPFPDPVVAAETIARRTATNLSSMLQDVRRSAPTEIDAISGAIVQAGARVGVGAPINRTLWQLVKAMHVPTETEQKR